MNQEVLFIALLCVRRTRDLDFLGEEDGFYVPFVVEDIHPREHRSVLEGGQTLLERSVDVRLSRRDGGG
jgi:hypothetical protein